VVGGRWSVVGGLYDRGRYNKYPRLALR